jgi:transcriptional regulator with XRE-family HTH domain
MSKEIFKTIKKLRLTRGISQAEMAQKMGIARTSYIAVEQGNRELTLAEAAKIGDVFGLSLEELEGGSMPNYAKYKEIILAYLRDADRVGGAVPKTKLAKLVYLADFGWFYDHLFPMSGMSYRKFQFGPVPDAYFRAIEELSEDGRISIEQSGDAFLISENRGSQKRPLGMLSRDESAFIKKVSDRWKHKRTKEIVDFTHNQLPYKLCADDEVIPYELITQEDPENVY